MILIVEDHADTRSLLEKLLAREGYRSASCGCGGDAVAFLRDHTPHLVILDCGLPDIGGLDVFRSMRSDARLAGTPVMMYSAFDGEKRDAALAAGVDAYLVKGLTEWTELKREIVRLAGPPPTTLP